MAQAEDEESQKLLTSLELIQKGEDEVIRFKPFNEELWNQSPRGSTSLYVHNSSGSEKIIKM